MKLSTAVFVAAALTLSAGAAPAQTSAPAIPDELKPIRAAGVGLNVADLERSKRFYTEVLGFKVAARVPASGEAVEYLLGLNGDLRGDTLVVLRKVEKVDPAAAGFGRLVLTVPDGRKLAERAAAAGYPPARIADGTNFVRDPDGYTVELYQRPAPR
ncbi:VOC family protein [Phenylobacterium terrae]|uniref:VOC family protein n=1 Tax=Phenylobacterium terrae TaxID=2665495 RepID=A0ABW4N7S8_9CAUL